MQVNWQTYHHNVKIRETKYFTITYNLIVITDTSIFGGDIANVKAQS